MNQKESKRNYIKLNTMKSNVTYLIVGEISEREAVDQSKEIPHTSSIRRCGKYSTCEIGRFYFSFRD